MKTTATEFAESLRQIAAFYEEHPDLKPPYQDRFLIFVRENHKDQIAAFARAFGDCEKDVDSDYFMVRKWFGDVALEVNVQRNEVCERVQVGIKHIPEQFIAAKPAETIPAYDEPQYEWRCPDSILSGIRP